LPPARRSSCVQHLWPWWRRRAARRACRRSRQADAAAGDAGGQRRGVADDEDVAVGVRRDEVSVTFAEVVVEVQVAEQEVVGERLLDLRELLALAERDRRPRGGERDWRGC
jgi:hypothetical protein